MVEGTDDERFFERILKPKLQRKFNNVIIWKYASKTKKAVNDFINSINSMKADYIFLADINSNPCIQSLKETKKSKYEQLDKTKITAVIKEIESWYIAGIQNELRKKLKIPERKIQDTSKITKEDFLRFSENLKDMTPHEVKLEILTSFDFEIAKNRNPSLNYFINKYLD